MKISFDLDGVIARTDRWFFRMVNAMRKTGIPELLVATMEIDYYANRPLIQHPSHYLSSKDKGIIITSRKPIAQEVTRAWLYRHNISLPVIFSDYYGEIDWDDNYESASILAAKRKAATVTQSGIQVHFDNNPYIVKAMRGLLPAVVIIQVGGEVECHTT